MPERLSGLDVSLLYAEEATTPMHVGAVALFELSERDAALFYERLVELVDERIALVPRYRQKIRRVPGALGRPLWVDDASFDLSYHVRRSALPAPGSDVQLYQLVGRLMSRRLDRSRPLWETYVVEGMSGGRIALVTKTHHALVDGVVTPDIGQVILDATSRPRRTPRPQWRPRPEPGTVGLVTDAVTELVRRPSELVETARTALLDARATAGQVLGVAGGVLAAARTAARPAPESPLNVDIGEQRRFAVARTALDDYKAVRKAHGGTVNDVVLATVAGALRTWLLTRGGSVPPASVVRAMVPVSVRPGVADDGGEAAAGAGGADTGGAGRGGNASAAGATAGAGRGGKAGRRPAVGNRVSSYLVDLPIGEPNPVVRLAQVAYAMAAHSEAGRSIGADALVRLSGFAPSTLHALGARAASSLSRRLFNLVVTNVPGPQIPLYAAGARMREVFPVMPLARGQAVAIGVTSYDGCVYYGLNADWDAMADVDVLAELLEESLAELVGTVS